MCVRLGREAGVGWWGDAVGVEGRAGAWALTEPTNGSDASALQSTAQPSRGGWLLNGRKRWIGAPTQPQCSKRSGIARRGTARVG